MCKKYAHYSSFIFNLLLFVGISYVAVLVWKTKISSYSVYRWFWCTVLLAGCIPPKTLEHTYLPVYITEAGFLFYAVFFLAELTSACDVLCLHALLSITFHLCEGLLVFPATDATTPWDHFLLNNGWQQTCCQTLSLVEVMTRGLSFSQKTRSPFWYCGFLLSLTLSVLGIALRIWAIRTAGPSFAHTLTSVSISRDDRNATSCPCLIQWGPYSYCRHPGYAGWFMWAIGSQLLIGNYVCFFLYLVVGLVFLKRRIRIEENDLLMRYPAAYKQYRIDVPALFPRIRSKIYTPPD